MTWVWSLPIEVPPRAIILPERPVPERMRAIVPTFHDWDDARASVESMLECNPRPAEIVVVDDNGEGEPPRWARVSPWIRVVSYQGNRGPAFARNMGACLQTGTEFDWLYFTDGGCTRDRSFFEEIVVPAHRLAVCPVAIAAPVVGMGNSVALHPINCYMTEEAILNPPCTASGPQAIVTANAAVSLLAFQRVGGFRTDFPFAAGEDLDIGLRLRHLGHIAWAQGAIVAHRFEESVGDFTRRFRRYGAGNAHLEAAWCMPSLRVGGLVAGRPELQWLADLQSRSMQVGYDSHRRARAHSA